jgi:hypothetical protein
VSVTTVAQTAFAWTISFVAAPARLSDLTVALAAAAVDGLADDVGVAGVPRGHLNHVHHWGMIACHGIRTRRPELIGSVTTD